MTAGFDVFNWSLGSLVATGLDGAGLDGADLDGTVLDGAGLDRAGLDGRGLDGVGCMSSILSSSSESCTNSVDLTLLLADVFFFDGFFTPEGDSLTFGVFVTFFGFFDKRRLDWASFSLIFFFAGLERAAASASLGASRSFLSLSLDVSCSTRLRSSVG